MITTRLYIIAGIVLLALAGVWYYGHTRYNAGVKSGQASGQAIAAKATTARDLALAQNNALSQTLVEVNNAAEAAKVSRDTAQAKAADAAKQATAIRTQADKDAAAFAKALDAATKTPACANLKETLCPAVQLY